MRPPDEYITLSLPSNPKYLGLLREVVGRSAEIFGFSEEEKLSLMLAVNEGCANIIEHCYGRDPSQKIDVTLHLLPDRMEVELRDYGEYFEEGGRSICDEELREGGLGLRLMKSVMDEVVFRPAEREGTLLTMVKYRAARRS